MKIIMNEKKIQRNKKIGQFTTFSSLAILILGFIATFTPSMMNWSLAALLVGFVLSQVGIYFGSRYGKSPRPDEKISNALKGLGDKYHLYHYSTAVPHLLVGPAGIWVFIPYTQGGTIIYDTAKRKWRQKGGNLYLKLFAQEAIGKPDLDIKSYLTDAQKYLTMKLGKEFSLPPIKPALIFLNEKVVIQCPDAPTPTLAIAKLKEFIRHVAKEEPLQENFITEIQQTLPFPS